MMNNLEQVLEGGIPASEIVVVSDMTQEPKTVLQEAILEKHLEALEEGDKAVVKEETLNSEELQQRMQQLQAMQRQMQIFQQAQKKKRIVPVSPLMSKLLGRI